MDDFKQAQLPEEALRMGMADGAEAKMPLPSVDAFYEVTYTEEGVFLEVTREQGEGSPLRAECVLFDLTRRNIDGFNPDITRIGLRRNDARIRLGGPQTQKSADSDLIVCISKDTMQADMMLFPPVISGAEKSADQVMARITKDYEVTYGLNEQLVRDTVVRKDYYKYKEIAQGRAPEKGKDGEIVLMFSPNRSYAPTILPDGSADYKNMDLFVHVSKGDVVATVVPPEDGIDGFTVKGVCIPAQRGKEKKLPKGKNVAVSEDGRSLVAEKSGRVDMIKDRIEVSDVHHVHGDVDMSVGNVNFDGDVVIDGNVISGLTVEATGSIEVRGYVEGATLIAGKDIVLRNGMQGMSQGKLEAGGNIVARFIERTTLLAKGSVFADYMVYCLITAGENVLLKGKFGKLLGGVVRAGKEITAKTIGSPGSDRTQIELGILPDERARYTKMDAERGQIKAQLNRVQNITRMPPPSDMAPDRLAMREKLIEAAQQLEAQYNSLTEQMQQLKEDLCANSNARVNATKAVYPNVRIQIDAGVFTTKSMIEFATFRCHEGQVTFTACEVKA